MDKYEKSELHQEHVSEPMEAYGYETLEQDVDTKNEYLPADIVNGAAQFALWEEEHGKLIPNDKVLDYVYKDLGWK